MTGLSESLGLAWGHHRAGRLPQAERIYREILKQQPDQADALHGLGMVALQTASYERAEELLLASLEARPYSANTWFSLGNLRRSQSLWAEAVEAYEKALAIEPQSAAACHNLAYTHQKQGRLQDAIMFYRKALELEPDYIEADVNLANTLHAQGELTKEQEGHYALLNKDLAAAYKQQGDLETAITYYLQAIAMNPSLEGAHYELAVIYQQTGKVEEAIAGYRRVLQLNPIRGDIHLQLGKIYQDQKKLGDAGSAYRRGLTLSNPRYEKAAKTREDTSVAKEVSETPVVPQAHVVVGGYRFPAISSIRENEKERPFWSVVVPIYNRTDYVLECLSSVLAQWGGEKDMEILVMDNASTPPLRDLVDSVGVGVVRYYRNRQNIGVRRSLNLGIALSRGKWIHVLPEDEYVLPSFYPRLRQSLEQCPDCVGAAFTGYENINDEGEVVFRQEHHGLHQGINQDWLSRIGVSNMLNPCAVVIRRAAHEQLGGYDPENVFTPDWELYKRTAVFYQWWYEPGVLARCRRHANNMTSELLLAGAQAVSYLQGIEISEGYLPPKLRQAITAKARRHYFRHSLAQTRIPLQAGNRAGALRLLQDALKIDSSPQAVQHLFEWLNNDEAAPLREEITRILRSMTLEDAADNFYFAYP